MRLTAEHEVTSAAHSLQYAQRISGLPLMYWHQPWYTKRRWRWAAIALLILALIAVQLTGSDVVAW